MKQSDLCVLALVSKGDWCRAYELERIGVAFSTGIEVIGSEADTRLYEVFDKNVPDTGFAIVKINGAEYTVETRKEGGARLWRAFLSKEKPPKLVINEDAPPIRIDGGQWRPQYKYV
jgi:hypothetical protein